MVVPPIFTADIPVSPSKKILAFLGFYSDKPMFLIWCCISLSANEIYLRLHSLKEIYGLVQHYAHNILSNILPNSEPQKLVRAEVLFVSYLSESLSLGYSASVVLSFSVWLCGY